MNQCLEFFSRNIKACAPVALIVFTQVQWVPSALALEVPVLTMEEASKKLAGGGYVLMIRHAQTETGVGDPPNFKLDDCKTQRNLSEEGRAQAKKIGEALTAASIRVGDVASSEWCRCKETAELMFGNYHTWAALNSFFANLKRLETLQTAELRNMLPYVKVPKNVAWITHQVNITALTGFVTNPAEIIVLRLTKDKPLAEFRFAPVK